MMLVDGAYSKMKKEFRIYQKLLDPLKRKIWLSSVFKILFVYYNFMIGFLKIH